jgi:N-sulfoglucosamine sulfohydrolase
MWKRGIRAPGRVVTDYASFVDLAPTFIEVAGLDWGETGMAPAAGRSLMDIFRSGKAGRVNPSRDHVLLGQERHDAGRPHDWGYPIRSILKDGWIYMHNFEPSRWPACNPETGYLNTDGGATKTDILDAHRRNPGDPHWVMCFGRRGAEELYDIEKDPDCITNLAAVPGLQERKALLKRQLFDELRAQEDPRMFGNGGVFEAEPYANEAQRGFYERFMKGEKVKAGWVNDTDFEKAPME